MARKKKKKSAPAEPPPAAPLSPHEQFLAAVDNGQERAVQELIDLGELSVVAPDGEGHTPLWHAAVYGSVPVMRVLIENGASVNAVSPADQVQPTTFEGTAGGS